MAPRPDKVLVTGAAGLVGRVVARHLAEIGHAVRAVDRRTPGEAGADAASTARLEWRTGDLADPQFAAAAVEGVDAVVHLAAIPSPWGHPDLQVYAGNVAATYAVLDAAGRAGIRRALIASSISIYGLAWSEREPTPPEIPLSETSELRIADPYALSKRADEACAEMMHLRWGMDVLSYRLPNMQGTEATAARGAEVQADQTVAHRELWAYLHLEDAAAAFALGLTADFGGAIALNVVAPGTIGDVEIAAVAPRFWPEIPVGLPAGRPVAGYTTERARSLLGFRAARRWDGEALPHDDSKSQGVDG